MRDARFSRRVIGIFLQQRTLCDVRASAWNSQASSHLPGLRARVLRDEPWNGLALCPNHHLAFDRYLVAIDIDTRAIVFHPDVIHHASGSPAVKALIDGTFHRLAEPAMPGGRPRSDMLRKRYEHYADYYGWMGRR